MLRSAPWILAGAITLCSTNCPLHAAPLETLSLQADDLEGQTWLTPSGVEEGTFTVAQMRTSREPIRQNAQQDASGRPGHAQTLSLLTMMATPGLLASGAYLISPEPLRVFPMALGAFVLPATFYLVSELHSAQPASAKFKSPWDNYLILGFLAASLVGYPAYEVYDVYRLRQEAGNLP